MSIILKERLGQGPKRAAVVNDCVALVEDQVRAKSGLSGVAIKGAYGTIKRVKKQFVPEVIEGMLDDWLDKIQPYYERWTREGQADKNVGLGRFLGDSGDSVAEDLLSVTDERAERTRHGTAKKAYTRMRGSAKRNVMDAIPDLGRLIEKHLAGS